MDIHDEELNTIKELITLKKELYIPIDLVIKKLGLNMKKEDIIGVVDRHDYSSMDIKDENDMDFPVAGIIIQTKHGNADLTRTKKKPDNDESIEEIEMKNRRNNLKLLSKRKEE